LTSLEEIRREKARRKLIEFTKYTKKDYEVNWHHQRLADVLDRFVKKEIRRLIIMIPPRHGKSEIGSRRLPAFILGQNPNARIIATSYSASLAGKMSRDVQRIINSREYHELFPNTVLANSEYTPFGKKYKQYSRTLDYFEIVGHEGYYLSAGVGGGITGQGADYAIVDDPIKNRKEAESPAVRQAIFDWFTSTLYTRLEKDACILIIMTRWHEDDLVGRLLRLAEEDPYADQWVVIKYPAIYDEKIPNLDPTDPREPGEPLWPQKYSSKQLATIKATVGSYEWNSLYQQTPSPPSGAIFQREWFQYYQKVPDKLDEVIQSWDFTFKDTNESDYVVGQVWGRKGADKYLLDQVRGKMSFMDSINAVISLSAKWPMAKAKIIEEKANGPAVISVLKKQISGLIPYNPRGSKVERAYAVTPQFESGNVYIPHPKLANWVHDYVEELVAFPNGLHDDQVDCTTQALIRLDKSKSRTSIRAKIY